MFKRYQAFSDDLLARVLLPFIPHSVTPNQVTIVRIVLLPVIAGLLFAGQYGVGLALFLIAALTDALDGALARKRNQETDTGKILDATADYGLIGVCTIILIPPLLGWWLVWTLVIFGVLNALMAYRASKKAGAPISANPIGKITTIIQCIAIAALFIAKLSNDGLWLSISFMLFAISLPFNLLEAFAYD